jgi:glycosyltransferase involved in cell wall biosynthesis
MTESLRISMVCTVRNEEDNIAQLIESMIGQSMAADEIVINDCNSDDATIAIVQQYINMGYPLRLVTGGHNIPSGRNNAIHHATGDVIACTDAGLILDRHWLRRITEPLCANSADMVAGFFRPLPRSVFELAIGSTNYRDADEIDPATFLAFGKSVAFKKSAWDAVSGYPEWATHCEDVLFDLAVKQAGFRMTTVLDAFVYFRPRENMRQFMRQYYLYARGDAVAGLWPRRHAIRYMVYLWALLLVVIGGWGWALLGIGMLAYVQQPWQRLWRRFEEGVNGWQCVAAAGLVPWIRIVGDGAKMVGYVAGWVRLWQHPHIYQERETWLADHLPTVPSA